MKIESHFFKALDIETFVALDTETTGLNPDTSEIIEIGMVCVRNGKLNKRYHQLFKPQTEISRAITHLTGIRNEDCVDKPPLNEHLENIEMFLDSPWIVAHNANFDISFLQKAFGENGARFSTRVQSKILDTLEISRLLLPWMKNHKLQTLVEFFSVDMHSTHRALVDAEAVAQLFPKLLHQLTGLRLYQIDLILRILQGSNDGLKTLIKNVRSYIDTNKPVIKPHQTRYDNNILGKTNSNGDDQSELKVSEMKVEAFFKQGGIFAKILPQYEFRKPQLELAKWAFRSLNQDLFLIAEAGTGVGKSLAYLVPVILWVMRTNGHVIIATYTKPLQKQLFLKELPMLNMISSKPFQTVLLKGRSNYLCINRWHQLLENMNSRLSSNQKRRLLPLVNWVNDTETGDIEENHGFSQKVNHDLWSQLNCDAGRCLGQLCPHESSCYLQRVRRASRSANIVIINHSLLFSDLVNQNSILGNYDTLIIDEAHQIERVASQYLGNTLQYFLFKEVIQRIYQPKPNETGIVMSLLDIHTDPSFKNQDWKKLKESIKQIKTFSEQLKRDAIHFFKALERCVASRLNQQTRYQKLRFRSSDELFGMIQTEAYDLENILKNLENTISNFLKTYTDNPSKKDYLEFELISILELIIELKDRLIKFSQTDYQSNVVWCEIEDKIGEKNPKLFMVPLNMAGLLDENFYPKLKRCILTSATLTVCQQFEYIMHRLGLDRIQSERVQKKSFGSPFSFEDQVLFLIPAYVSNPRETMFVNDIIQCLQGIIRTCQRGTLALFTSHFMLQKVYNAILLFAEEHNVHLLGQGLDGSRSLLLKLFQNDEKSVLLGTNSFWEGIDVPGRALELLVITKIPFDVPTDPLIEAHLEKTQSETGNGFLNYAVPEAIVKLKQGFGRLIRSHKDRGVVILMDNRVIQTEYGRFFMQSLPIQPKICQSEGELFKQIDSWFA